MKKYIQITFNITGAEESDMLIASLQELPFYAFEEKENKLIAYIFEQDYNEHSLQQNIPLQKIDSVNLLEEENWNQQWESNFKPVQVDDFAIIRASFHSFPGGILHDLVITPKMSFGTGHHATTWLMISQMQKINFLNKSVMDFGTGTGVLAILAEKCGAKEVLAIDHDTWSIENIKENIETNQCYKIKVKQHDQAEGEGTFDIILANINLNVLKQSAKAIASQQVSGGSLLLSGFLKNDVPKMESVFSKQGYLIRDKAERENWVCILAHKS